MAEARYISYCILYDGQEIGLSDRLKSLSYIDNSSGVSDEITLTFEAQNASWLRGDFIPEKEHDLDVTLFFHNWNSDGSIQSYHCGNFTLDDITYSSPPSQCTIKGVSIPANEAFQVDPVTKTWKMVTLKQIAEEIKNKYGMETLLYWGEESVIETVEQSNQTDSAFLYDLCTQQGMFLKVYKKALIIFDKAIYEPRGVKTTFTENDFENFEWNSTLHETYTGATISYTIPKKMETISVTVGQGPRLLHINEKADNEAEAMRIAKAKVNTENEKAVTLSFQALGNPKLNATNNIQVHGMGRLDGKYFVEKITHNVSGSAGHKMRVNGYRIFERL